MSGKLDFEFDVKLCDSKTSCQVVPKKRLELKLVPLRNKLEEAGTLLAVTPYVAVLRSAEGIEFSVYSSGKILFRKLLDREKARKLATRVYSLLGV
jgi:hypothetical protein